jgi:hypothetical protein
MTCCMKRSEWLCNMLSLDEMVRVPTNTSRDPGFDSPRYETFWIAMFLERYAFGIVITEELLEWQVAAPVYKMDINGSGNPLRWPCDILLPTEVGSNFSDRRRPLGWYIYLAYQKPLSFRGIVFSQSSCWMFKTLCNCSLQVKKFRRNLTPPSSGRQESVNKER